MRIIASVLSALFFGLLAASLVFAHCQIPCGIYDDELRVKMLEEHITTIEKSMNEITRMSQEGDKNYNQIVRWVTNKDEHADEFSETVTYYFMTQRVKLVDDKTSDAYKTYLRQLTLLHEMLVYAMKAKQTTDLTNVQKLRSLVADFRIAYFGPSGTGQEQKH